MEKIPILKMGEFLLVTVQVDLYDRLATGLENDLVNMISKHESKGVLIDISAVSIVDSFMGRILSNIAQMSKILDAHTVVVGMQPAVAIILIFVAHAHRPSIRYSAYSDNNKCRFNKSKT